MKKKPQNLPASGLSDEEFHRLYEAGIQTALKEIGTIRPRWSKADSLFVFSHKAYPGAMYAHETEEGVKKGYQRAIYEFVADRLNRQVAPFMDKATSGRGGWRPGAGRPAKAHPATKTVRVPYEMAERFQMWLRVPENVDALKRIISG